MKRCCQGRGKRRRHANIGARSGAGIPANFRPHIFKKFAQADATNTRQKGGTGLGLSIAKQIVERLGGELNFCDAPGGGTIFTVGLPALPGRSHEFGSGSAHRR